MWAGMEGGGQCGEVGEVGCILKTDCGEVDCCMWGGRLCGEVEWGSMWRWLFKWEGVVCESCSFSFRKGLQRTPSWMIYNSSLTSMARYSRGPLLHIHVQ